MTARTKRLIGRSLFRQVGRGNFVRSPPCARRLVRGVKRKNALYVSRALATNFRSARNGASSANRSVRSTNEAADARVAIASDETYFAGRNRSGSGVELKAVRVVQ